MEDIGIGLHVAHLPTKDMGLGRNVAFTFYWPEVEVWENENQEVRVT